MDGFVDLDEAIKAEASSRLEKVEKLAGISAMALLGGAVWLALANFGIWDVRGLSFL